MSYGHYRYAEKRDLETKSNQLLNLFQALNGELTAIWERYMAVVGGDLEKAKQPDELPFTVIFTATHNYFSVYDNSAQLLGTLEPESGKRIIETYINLKSLLDELQNYNHMAQKHRDVRLGANLNLYEVGQVREELDRILQAAEKKARPGKRAVPADPGDVERVSSLAEQSRTSVKINI